MRVKKSYIIDMSRIVLDEFIEVTEIITDRIPCSIAYNSHNNGEWYEMVVTCYDYDSRFVELMLVPFV